MPDKQKGIGEAALRSCWESSPVHILPCSALFAAWYHRINVQSTLNVNVSLDEVEELSHS